MNRYYTESNLDVVPIIEDQAIIVHDATELSRVAASFAYRCTLTLYVTQGEALWVGQNESIRLTKGDMLIHNMENARAELVPDEGFGMMAVCVSSEFKRQFSLLIKVSWKVRQALVTNALFHLTPEDRRQMVENFDFLKMKCQGRDFAQRTIILKHLLHILSVEMLLRIESYIREASAQQGRSQDTVTRKIELASATSAQNIFNRFTALLEQTPVKNRPVSWWAARVGVSAKYLSAICRMVEGKSARTLIAESVIQEASRLLESTDLTVKEISDRLGFVNQSHFGTFYKRHTGHAPMKRPTPALKTTPALPYREGER